MDSFADLSEKSIVIILALAFLLAVAILVLAFVAYLYKRQQRLLRRQEMIYRDIA